MNSDLGSVASTQREEGGMSAATWNIAGLILNAFGVLLLFRFGVPFRVRNEDHFIADERYGQVSGKDRLYTFLGWLGLVCILIGTAFQIKGNL
jgi:hypothetical protein